MAGRSEARIFASIWRDRDFLALSRRAQGMFFFLLSQPDLTHCGAIPLREAKWAPKADELSEAEVNEDIAALEEREFVVVDRSTRELLVRSLVRRDKVLRQPFLFQAVAESADAIDSPLLRATLAGELARCREEGDINKRITGDLDRLIDTLSTPLPGTDPDRDQERHPDRHSDSQQGIGGGNGRSVRDPLSPVPGSPSPRQSAAAIQHPLLAAVPDPPNEGEGDQDREQLPDVAAFVDGVRLIHPEWSSASIRRTAADVAERGWPLVLEAALICYADPQTQHPGRLKQDGDWWPKAAAKLRGAGRPGRPPWCGDPACNEQTRMRETPDGDPYRCPGCGSGQRERSVAS